MSQETCELSGSLSVLTGRKLEFREGWEVSSSHKAKEATDWAIEMQAHGSQMRSVCVNQHLPSSTWSQHARSWLVFKEQTKPDPQRASNSGGITQPGNDRARTQTQGPHSWARLVPQPERPAQSQNGCGVRMLPGNSCSPDPVPSSNPAHSASCPGGSSEASGS